MPVYYPSSSNSSSRSSSSEVKRDLRQVTHYPPFTTTNPSNPSKPKSRLHPVDVHNDPYAPKDQDRRTKEQDAGYYPRSSFQTTNSYSQSHYTANPTRAPPRGYRS